MQSNPVFSLVLIAIFFYLSNQSRSKPIGTKTNGNISLISRWPGPPSVTKNIYTVLVKAEVYAVNMEAQHRCGC